MGHGQCLLPQAFPSARILVSLELFKCSKSLPEALASRTLSQTTPELCWTSRERSELLQSRTFPEIFGQAGLACIHLWRNLSSREEGEQPQQGGEHIHLLPKQSSSGSNGRGWLGLEEHFHYSEGIISCLYSNESCNELAAA